jgi:hypothetical protein
MPLYLPLRFVTLVSAFYCLSLSFEYNTSILMRLYKKWETTSSMALLDGCPAVTVPRTRAFQLTFQDGFGEVVRFSGIALRSTRSLCCNS